VEIKKCSAWPGRDHTRYELFRKNELFVNKLKCSNKKKISNIFPALWHPAQLARGPRSGLYASMIQLQHFKGENNSKSDSKDFRTLCCSCSILQVKYS